jgi:hypothetical protein
MISLRQGFAFVAQATRLHAFTMAGGSPALHSRSRKCLFVVFALVTFVSAAAAPDEDHRAWQHGIDLLRIGDKLLLVWGSPGNPPLANPGGDWQHDIYTAWINPTVDAAALPLEPRRLVSRPEAQEPPSAAINSRGAILVTSEDGSDDINQYAGLWDSSLRVLRKYPIEIRRGGHSGHVAALGENFLVAYGEGWVDGGGFLDRGTGKDIYVRSVGPDGKPGSESKLSSGHRDGWPLVAASDRNWLVVWQRYPEMTLQSALISGAGNVIVQHRIIDAMPVRYAYDVEYAPALGVYVVAGSTGEEGFVALVGRNGELLKLQRGLPPMASESRIIIGRDGAQTIAVYPVRPRGVAVVRLSANAVELVRLIDHPYAWDYAGTTGVFIAPAQILFATLSTTGVRLIAVKISD